jgi:hypothetical protein
VKVHVDWLGLIFQEISDKQRTRREIAHTYGILIRTGHKEFAEINRAILGRWTRSGLEWIKQEAWYYVNNGEMR